MSDIKKKSVPYFNVISMKDIKDKTTKNSGLRPLFDCVTSLGESSESLKKFLASDAEGQEMEVVEKMFQQLADMQVKLLELCKSKVQQQREADFYNEEQIEQPTLQTEPQMVGTQDQQPPMPKLNIQQG